MKLIGSINRPRQPPDYRTVELFGGLGDAVYSLFNGPFAKTNKKLFVVNNTHHQGAISELLATSTNVARVVEAQTHCVSTFPYASDAPAPTRPTFPLLPDESLRPETKYVVIHPMSSADKDISTSTVQWICKCVNKLGLTPVLVGKDCQYNYPADLFDTDWRYAKAEQAQVTGAVDLINRTNPRQLFDLVENAAFVVASHSLVAQMAWAMKVPCFCILPDYFFFFCCGRAPSSYAMYQAPLFRPRNGFLFFSDLHLLDRFFIHFLLKNGYGGA